MFGIFKMREGRSRWERASLEGSWELMKFGEGGLIYYSLYFLYIFESFYHKEFVKMRQSLCTLLERGPWYVLRWKIQLFKE